ncbi:SDR family oxidoreductase [Bradymonas sediminis]|uniref:Peroxisomal trans-2-enoyl-CoA reductase n=1 Tax=Bradymonas sediminis TaxID=1548548 RepID=A0A2Z4FQM6_9DELT|nr:SDR family oxidoreductase [Bradymonas sediminis]AWV91230.1 2,4-dienoyl-CoA reductase [Bradymonas sediminis]TDP73797.1 citronellol/citronellal dehydrogenase [Bradymonas sediminis]
MSCYESIFRDALFAGQVGLVTGGGSGIGRCIAHEMARLGAHVVLVGRTVEKLERVAAEIAEDGGSASWWACDIRDEAGVKAMVAEIVAAHGRVDMLVNNAGGQYPSPLAHLSKKGWEAVVATNLTGGFLMAREVFEQSMQTFSRREHRAQGRPGPAIVNIIADMWRGMPGMAHSGAARAGMQNLTMTAAVEWARFGIRVNAVAPGWIASAGMETYDEPMKTTITHLHKSVPLKRLGTESEVSAAVCFLLSPAAAFMTGQTLSVDGGAPLYPNQFPIPAHSNSLAFNGFHRATTPAFLSAHLQSPEDADQT